MSKKGERMNKKFMLFFGAVIVFTVSSSALGQDFYLKSISKDKQTVVIGQKESNRKWTVRTGDKIENWNVIEIKNSHVILQSDPDEVTNLTRTIALTLPAIETIPSVPDEDKK
jgi:hypothetical protein